MLTVLGNRRRTCDGLTRRELLRIGGTELLGMSLSRVWRGTPCPFPAYVYLPKLLGHFAGYDTNGQFDKDAAYPDSHPASPADPAATIYDALGSSPDLRIPDAQGRPVSLVENGRPLSELFGQG